MKKRLTILLVICTLAFSLVGCGETMTVNVENKEELNEDTLGENALVYVGNELYYDSTTRIVYMKHYSPYGSSYCAYYASNGLPYRYNPETNTFEEIKID